jgi:hypothetical protein
MVTIVEACELGVSGLLWSKTIGGRLQDRRAIAALAPRIHTAMPKINVSACRENNAREVGLLAAIGSVASREFKFRESATAIFSVILR